MKKQLKGKGHYVPINKAEVNLFINSKKRQYSQNSKPKKMNYYIQALERKQKQSYNLY
jgi:hypothetical protein